MGFLKVFGRPLSFEESKVHFQKIRNSAVETIIDWINSSLGKRCFPKFGYEIEIHKISIDDDKKKVYLDLSAEDTIIRFIEHEEKLQNDKLSVSESNKKNSENNSNELSSGAKETDSEFIFQFEYGRWMIEIVPRSPLTFDNMRFFEESFKNLYEFIDNTLGKNQVLSCGAFPKLGDSSQSVYYNAEYLKSSSDAHQNKSENETALKEIEDGLNELYSSNEDLDSNPFSNSKYINDSIINTHPRFGTLTRNIRARRGSLVSIQVPIYKDINTIYTGDPNPGFIDMDAMVFGMGCCALQITLGTCTLNSTCYLYDQFLPLMPLLLALSSSAPIYRGKLSGFDNRFSVISQAVDDRTEEERNPMSNKYIYKSRYSAVYSYISQHEYVQDYHNDYPKFPINEEYLKTMVDGGIPERLSRHFCNLLVRDPLVIFENKIDLNDKSDRSHFENFNSTNWNSLRFKPPRIEDNDTCFKIEVRPCDLQLTPFENSSFLGLLLALYSSVLNYDVNFIIPITKVDENFERAYLQDSITEKKFWWRINSIDKDFKNIKHNLIQREFLSTKDGEPISKEIDDQNIKELTMKEIFFGSEEYNYPGILKLCYKAIELRFADEETRSYAGRFIEFIGLRASGELWTDAKYMRNFVLNHPKYNKDSVVTDEIQYDLIKQLLRIQNREFIPEELFGSGNKFTN